MPDTFPKICQFLYLVVGQVLLKSVQSCRLLSPKRECCLLCDLALGKLMQQDLLLFPDGGQCSPSLLELLSDRQDAWIRLKLKVGSAASAHVSQPIWMVMVIMSPCPLLTLFLREHMRMRTLRNHLKLLGLPRPSANHPAPSSQLPAFVPDRECDLPSPSSDSRTRPGGFGPVRLCGIYRT